MFADPEFAEDHGGERGPSATPGRCERRARRAQRPWFRDRLSPPKLDLAQLMASAFEVDVSCCGCCGGGSSRRSSIRIPLRSLGLPTATSDRTHPAPLALTCSSRGSEASGRGSQSCRLPPACPVPDLGGRMGSAVHNRISRLTGRVGPAYRSPVAQAGHGAGCLGPRLSAQSLGSEKDLRSSYPSGNWEAHDGPEAHDTDGQPGWRVRYDPRRGCGIVGERSGNQPVRLHPELWAATTPSR